MGDHMAVFRSLRELFPQVDTRVLKAVAIEHQKDIDSAVVTVLDDVMPTMTGSVGASHDRREAVTSITDSVGTSSASHATRKTGGSSSAGHDIRIDEINGSVDSAQCTSSTEIITDTPQQGHAPAFIFAFNQQHAVAVAAAANRVGDTKSSGVSNAMPPSATAHSSAANPGAPAMNLSFANIPPPADAQFLAILQNGAYQFPVAAHAGGPQSYRGMTPPGPAVPFFNGHAYPSHMLHPSQQQGAQQQNHQKNPMPSLSTSSQKHQPQQSQGLLGYAPNANAAAAAAASANSSQNYLSGNQRPVLLPGLSHRQDAEKTMQDGLSSDDKSSHPHKGGYDHNFAVPVHLPNFALMPAAGNQSEKKLSDHHHHQQPPTSRGQGVRIDLASSQPFVVPFGSIGAPGSAPTGLDFSSLAQNHALFQSHQEAGRHGYPQLSFAAAQSAQGAHHKPQHQVTAEAKSAAVDSSSTPSAGENERKKSASAKYPGKSLL